MLYFQTLIDIWGNLKKIQDFASLNSLVIE